MIHNRQKLVNYLLPFSHKDFAERGGVAAFQRNATQSGRYEFKAGFVQFT